MLCLGMDFFGFFRLVFRFTSRIYLLCQKEKYSSTLSLSTFSSPSIFSSPSRSPGRECSPFCYSEAVCWFPMVAVTNDHRHDVLQHTFILSQSWRPDVRSQFHWTNIKMSERLVPSDSSRGQYISLPFLASGGHLCSLTGSPFSTSVRAHASVITSLTSFSVVKSPLASAF